MSRWNAARFDNCEEKIMQKKICAIKSFALLVVIGTACQTFAQDAAKASPKMAPIEPFLMDRDAEIALARTAVPASIGRDADVLVLGRHGYETAVKGKNGFVCYVGRSWAAAADPDFGDPKVRVPMCLNAAAARTYLLRVTRATDLAMAGQTLVEVNAAIAAAVAKKELPPMESGSIGYMMGKEGFGGNSAPHWPSHIMFFYTDTDPGFWGANLAGSPIIAVKDPDERMTSFVIPVAKWSDGSDALPGAPHVHPSSN
jgi:hypothetical protein